MGLYLCVFDEADNELEGVEVGSYADFNFFRDAVTAVVEKGEAGAVCPTLNNHLDSDGEWSSSDSMRLLLELDQVAEAFLKCPPVEYNTEWKDQVAKVFGINPETLLECFFDVDGEPLVERLQQLAKVSVDSG
ncbi:MAG: Imm70 family immunity protein, partial [Gammaproteobacteria bacterium]